MIVKHLIIFVTWKNYLHCVVWSQANHRCSSSFEKSPNSLTTHCLFHNLNYCGRIGVNLHTNLRMINLSWWLTLIVSRGWPAKVPRMLATDEYAIVKPVCFIANYISFCYCFILPNIALLFKFELCPELFIIKIFIKYYYMALN